LWNCKQADKQAGLQYPQKIEAEFAHFFVLMLDCPRLDQVAAGEECTQLRLTQNYHSRFRGPTSPDARPASSVSTFHGSGPTITKNFVRQARVLCEFSSEGIMRSCGANTALRAVRLRRIHSHCVRLRATFQFYQTENSEKLR
jgi:hypothetical protein